MFSLGLDRPKCPASLLRKKYPCFGMGRTEIFTANAFLLRHVTLKQVRSFLGEQCSKPILTHLFSTAYINATFSCSGDIFEYLLQD